MDLDNMCKTISIKKGYTNKNSQEIKAMIILDILKNDHITRKAMEIAIKRKYSNLLE